MRYNDSLGRVFEEKKRGEGWSEVPEELVIRKIEGMGGEGGAEGVGGMGGAVLVAQNIWVSVATEKKIEELEAVRWAVSVAGVGKDPKLAEYLYGFLAEEALEEVRREERGCGGGCRREIEEVVGNLNVKRVCGLVDGCYSRVNRSSSQEVDREDEISKEEVCGMVKNILRVYEMLNSEEVEEYVDRREYVYEKMEGMKSIPGFEEKHRTEAEKMLNSMGHGFRDKKLIKIPKKETQTKIAPDSTKTRSDSKRDLLKKIQKIYTENSALLEQLAKTNVESVLESLVSESEQSPRKKQEVFHLLKRYRINLYREYVRMQRKRKAEKTEDRSSETEEGEIKER